MKISQYNSNKITVLNTVLIMMVLYIHSYYLEGNDHAVSYVVQRFMGTSAMMNVAVLLFFAMSGFLFFNDIVAVKDCLLKMQKRVRSLVVPYVIWNVIFVLWYLVLGTVPGVSSFINSDILANFATPWCGGYYLLIKPASFPLWFLRDLIVFVACSPLVYLALRYLRWWAMPVAIVTTKFLPFVGFFYFVIGGCVATLSSLEDVERVLNKKTVVLCAFIYFGMCGYLAAQPIEANFEYNFGLTSVLGVTGLVTIWRGYDYIAKGRLLAETKFAKAVCGYSFFVFLFHEPVLNIIKKIPIRVLGESELVIIILFLINLFIMYLLAICIAKFLQNITPKVYNILVGGR